MEVSGRLEGCVVPLLGLLGKGQKGTGGGTLGSVKACGRLRTWQEGLGVDWEKLGTGVDWETGEMESWGKGGAYLGHNTQGHHGNRDMGGNRSNWGQG